jgi:hypothetical protein
MWTLIGRAPFSRIMEIQIGTFISVYKLFLVFNDHVLLTALIVIFYESKYRAKYEVKVDALNFREQSKS